MLFQTGFNPVQTAFEFWSLLDSVQRRHMGTGEGWLDVLIDVVNSVGVDQQPRRSLHKTCTKTFEAFPYPKALVPEFFV